jgi:nucleoside-diphosphate-sugar epimerase
MKHSLRETSYHGVPVTVLGATGFIGRWVAHKLCQQKARVHLIVRNRAAAKQVFDRYGIQGEVSEVDLGDLSAVQRVFERVNASIIFNLAGYGVAPSETDQATAYQINAYLVEALAQAVARTSNPDWPGQQIVHVGSAAEYGAMGGGLSVASIPSPTTLYGKSKLAGTLALEQHSKSLGIRCLTARLFSVYGPGEHPGRLLPLLLRTAQTREPLALTSGEQLRDFAYVEDVAEGLLRLGLAQANPGQIVDLATGQLTSVRRFIEVAAPVLGIPNHCLQFGTIAMPEREKDWDREQVPVAVRQLRRLTGWLPTTGIEQGIRKTRWFEFGASG